MGVLFAGKYCNGCGANLDRATIVAKAAFAAMAFSRCNAGSAVVTFSVVQMAPGDVTTAFPTGAPTSLPTPVPSPVPTVPRSAQSCDELGWDPDIFGSSGVCGGSTLDGTTCSGLKTWVDALGFCEDGGARLCTLAELQNDEARGTVSMPPSLGIFRVLLMLYILSYRAHAARDF